MTRLDRPSGMRAALAIALLLGSLSCGDSGGGGEPTPNPVPTITSLSRDTATAGISPFLFVVRGSELVPGVEGLVDGSARSTARQNDSAVVVTLTMADLATPGDHQIQVRNPEPGGGVSGALTLHILPPPPVPVLDSISPDTASVGAPGRTLHAWGTGFTAKSILRFNDADQITTIHSATHLSMEIPNGTFTTARVWPVAVRTPAPGGGLSTTRGLTVTYPLPVITGTTPATLIAWPDTNPLAITVAHGAGLDTVYATNAGVTRKYLPFNSSDAIAYVMFDQAWLNADSALQLRVHTPVGMSAPFSVPLAPRSFRIDSIAPDTLDGTSIRDTLDIFGAGFVSSLALEVGGPVNALSVIDSTHIRAILLADAIAIGGRRTVRLFEPLHPQHQDTASVVLRTRAAVLDSLVEERVDSVGSLTHFVFISGRYLSQHGIARVNGVVRPHSVDGTSFLYVQVDAADLAQPDTLLITYENEAPTTGISNAVALVVLPPNPVPVVDSVTPRVIPRNGSGVTVTLHGQHFDAGIVARLGIVNTSCCNSPVAQTVIDPTTLELTLPDSLLNSVRELIVHLRNPAPTAGPAIPARIYVADPVVSSVRHIAKAFGQVIGDTTRGLIYGATEPYEPGGVQLLVIDPATGTVIDTLPADSAITDLAISADGAWLFAASEAGKSIRRYDLGARTLSRTWRPRSALGTPIAPVAIAAHPTDPAAVAVLTKTDFDSPAWSSWVYVYDDTLPRSNVGALPPFGGADLGFAGPGRLVVMRANQPGWYLLPVDSVGVDSATTVVGDFQLAGAIQAIQGDTGYFGNYRWDLLTGIRHEAVWGNAVTAAHGTIYSVIDKGYEFPIHEFRAHTFAGLTPIGTPIETTGMKVGSFHQLIRWGPGGFALGGYPGLSIVQINAPGW